MTLQEYINSIKNKRIAVLGIGISNLPLIRLLCYEGCNVTACDQRPFEQLGSQALELLALGAKLKLGKDYLSNLDYDLVFRTPGLMPFSFSTTGEVTSEMELFFRLCPCSTIAITGSDGKTTTSSIIAELLKKAGFHVHLGGNIGKPLLCEVPLIKKDDIAVLELSSFQLHSMICSPDIAVITNVSPNHLDKHKDYTDYINAKKQIFLNQKAGSRLVLNADDDIVSGFGGTDFFSVQKKVDGCYELDNAIYRYGRFLMRKDEILIPGEHNVKNFLAAFSATEGLVSDEICVDVAKNFQGVAHRLETVRVFDGITFINDSIGSSPTRTIAGLKSLRQKPIIILGGYDKLVPFDELGEEVVRRAKAAVITGATAEKISSCVDNAGYLEKYIVPDFDDAVRKAYEIAAPGDIVLLSPACASFDRFKNFEERGNHFKKIVMELR